MKTRSVINYVILPIPYPQSSKLSSRHLFKFSTSFYQAWYSSLMVDDTFNAEYKSAIIFAIVSTTGLQWVEEPYAGMYDLRFTPGQRYRTNLKQR